MATGTAAPADTFPKLLIRNANLYGARPAMRHKDLGIWQTWTWAQVLDVVRAYAVGLHRLGLKRGDTIAIVGANRPKLYWSVMAAQMLGAIPVPVYADAVADELAFVLAHAEVRFAAVEDQEQVDKILSVVRSPAQARGRWSTTSRAACATTITAICMRSTTSSPTAARRWQDPTIGAWLDARDRRRQGLRSVDHSLHLRHHRPVQGRGAVRRALHQGRRPTPSRSTSLTENDVALAYLPLAWVGDHYLNYAQGLVAGFCMACPESADTAMADLREIGPTLLLRAAAHVRADCSPAS